MASSRIIPGVSVEVVKDALPQQLSPSGVLGLVGLVEKSAARAHRASSWRTFLELAGAGSAYSLPEARQALGNGAYQLVVAPVESTVALRARADLSAVPAPDAELGDVVLTLEARAPGPWGNELSVEVTPSAAGPGFDLSVRRAGELLEIHRKLSGDPASDSYVAAVLARNSTLVVVATDALGDKQIAAQLMDLVGGTDASRDEYKNALMRLEDEPDVDMVLVATRTSTDVQALYAEVIDHCQRMSADCKGRIGFGEVPAGKELEAWKSLASSLVSDRFVLTAPHGTAGAVAGMVGQQTYFRSPTFKRVGNTGALSQDLGVDDQRSALDANVAPVVQDRMRGIILVKGITTDGDQISVRRVADRAVRGVRMIGDLFIGRLNNAAQRGALQQNLTQFLLQMEKDGAIVPKTDGSDPAFRVEVYASQADFAQGIVRVDLAVRPVRSIDYIYATVQVQI